MPTIKDNFRCWNDEYDWRGGGDEWSGPWGSPERQWVATIFPRISAFLPSPTILEIGPGRGRWTQFLKNYCDRLILVDLAPSCIKACQERFATEQNIQYVVNDGLSLSGVPEVFVDFIFSFDFLVHAGPRVLRSYIAEAAKMLTLKGTGFIHHSNLGAYHALLPKERPANEYWRSRTMSAQIFRDACQENHLLCVRQEAVRWLDAQYLLDCFSTFGKGITPQSTIPNQHFMREAELARRL